MFVKALKLREDPHLALARNGLIEKQTGAVLIIQTGVLGSCGARAHTAQAGYPEGFEAVC